MKQFSLILTMVAAVAFLSCSTDSEVNQESRFGVQFNTIQSASITQALNKGSQLKRTTNLSFASGYIAISKLEFEAETENNLVEIEFELKQNTIIDFATGATVPDINTISIPAGTYDEVEVEIELREGSEPAIILFGTYIAPDAVEHNIRFEFNSDESFEVEREGVIVFEEDEVAIAQITFDPIAWFAAVTDEDFANATKDADGTIVISSSQNTEIYDTVAEGLDLASDMEIEDEDDDNDDNDD